MEGYQLLIQHDIIFIRHSASDPDCPLLFFFFFSPLQSVVFFQGEAEPP